MKAKSYLLMALTALLLAGCDNDHTDLWKKINDNADRIKALEEWQEQVNSNLTSLQQLLSTTDYITGVTPVMQSGKQVGYNIQFLHSEAITIYNGEKGEDGKQGETGGTPQISVVQQTDGNWYWTLNGDLLKDDAGNAIQANGTKGEDGKSGTDGKPGDDGQPGQSGAEGPKGDQGPTGPTGATGDAAPIPQIWLGSNLPTGGGTIKTDGGVKDDTAWYLSVDDKKTWYRVSGTNGKNGTDGDAVFAKNGVDYTSSTEYVTFTLADNTPDDTNDNPIFRIPLYKGIGITFSLPDSPETPLDLSQTLNIVKNNVLNYEITGIDAAVSASNLKISAVRGDGEGWEPVIDRTAKTITLSSAFTTPTGTIVVMLTDNKDFSRSYMLTMKAEFEGDGPYQIYNVVGMQLLASLVNAGNTFEGKVFALKKDIYLSGVCGENLNNGEGINWIPIGNYDLAEASRPAPKNDLIKAPDFPPGHTFEGSFDGEGHTIYELYINNESSNGGGQIIYKSYTNNNEMVPQGLFGFIGSKGEVKNLTASGEIKATAYAGGIAGASMGKITQCVNAVIVSGSLDKGTRAQCIGGIVGANGYGGTITGCSNRGDVTGEEHIGGITGSNFTATITGCSNTGNVTGYSSIGGIAGDNYEGTLTGCNNTGDVSGDDEIGGVVGYSDGSLTACYNAGIVKLTNSDSRSNAGGIIGDTGSSAITIACYNTGNVTSEPVGEGNLGGIVGESDLNFSTCYWVISTVPGAPSAGIGTGSDTSIKVDGNTVDWTAACDAMNTAIVTWKNNNPGIPCPLYKANSDPSIPLVFDK